MKHHINSREKLTPWGLWNLKALNMTHWWRLNVLRNLQIISKASWNSLHNRTVFFISHRIWTCSIWLINQPVHFIIPAYWQSVCFGAADEREAATQGRADQSRREGRSHKGEQCGPGCCVQEQNLWCKIGCVSLNSIELLNPVLLSQHIYINTLLKRVTQGVVMSSVCLCFRCICKHRKRNRTGVSRVWKCSRMRFHK